MADKIFLYQFNQANVCSHDMVFFYFCRSSIFFTAGVPVILNNMQIIDKILFTSIAINELDHLEVVVAVSLPLDY